MSKDDARLSEALDFVLSQQFIEAIRFCEQHLGRKKSSALSFVYGHALVRVKRENEGKIHLKKNNFKGVKDAYCLYRMAHLAFELECYDDAIACYKRAIIYEKDFWEAYYNLGNSLKKIFKYEEAKEAYLKALKINPTYVDLLYNLAQVYESLNELQNAQSYYGKVLDITPNDSGAMTGIGRCVHFQKGLEAAEPFWLKAIEINPKSDDAYDAIVNAHISIRNFTKAQHFLDEAIDAGIQHQTIFLNMARILYAGERKTDLAKKVLIQAVEYYPRVPELWNMLLGIMIEKSEYSDAEKILNRLFSEGLELWYLKLAMSRVLFETSRITEAESVIKELLELNPDNGILISSLLAMMAYNSLHSPDKLFNAHKHYGALLEANKIGSLVSRSFDKKDGEIIKVGYVSPDFRDHATSRFVEPLIANHDRNHFHITLYSENKIEDQVTVRLKNYADGWCKTNTYDDLQLAQKFQEDEIDILVDLAGHTPGNRLGAFAYKPCPVQASFLGYPFTTGMKSIDYYFANEALVPREKIKYFVEKVEYIENDHSGSRPSKVPWIVEGQKVRADMPFDVNGYFTFGCFNRVEKLSEKMINAWVQILLDVPNSKLLLKNRNFDNKTFLESYRAIFTSKGIEEGRLIFLPSSKLTEYLASFNQVDMGLDTFPYNASTVSNDSLKMGVPFITLSGETTNSRVGAGFLKNISFDHFVTYSVEDYISLAVCYANDTRVIREARQFLYDRAIDDETYDIIVGPLEEAYVSLLNDR
ncbi:tetratricopeptide repeat protein [Kiloniella litopenaei]|uniref:O-linked N-acetylglucosamine transferase family protein n=1 Tax=Kiloniella litopenaei TaxID=1549748 RepID=UPI003BAA0A84